MKRALTGTAVAVLAALALPGAGLADGRPIPIDRLGSAWSAPPLVLAGAVMAIALYAQAFLRLRRRGRSDHAPWSAAVLFAAGIAAVLAALCSPLDPIGEQYLLSAHMLQHVLLLDVAPLLVVLSLRGPLCFFVIPQPALRRLGHLRAFRSFLHVLFTPLVALGIWAVVVLAWHVPVAYEATLSNQAVHDVEHLSFLFAGLVAWSELVDPARRGTLSRARRIAFALAMVVLAQPIMEALAFSDRVVYPSYGRQADRLFGLSPYADQHWAAVVMFTEQVATLGAFVAVMLWPYLRGPGLSASAEPAEPAEPALR